MGHDGHDGHGGEGGKDVHVHVHDHVHEHERERVHEHAREHEHGGREGQEGGGTVGEHRAHAPASVSAFVVTCSDTRAARTDESGALIRSLLERAGHSVVGWSLVKDEAPEIRRAVGEAIDQGARVVLVTGGTGLSRRDVTIETLTPLFEKAIPGFGELFRVLSFEQVKSAALLSRATAGVMRGAVVFAMPGSPAAVRLAMERLILPELGHLVREALR